MLRIGTRAPPKHIQFVLSFIPRSGSLSQSSPAGLPGKGFWVETPEEAFGQQLHKSLPASAWGQGEWQWQPFGPQFLPEGSSTHMVND